MKKSSYYKDYYHRNREKINKYLREWSRKNRDSKNRTQQKYRKKTKNVSGNKSHRSIKGKFRALKYTALKKGKGFNIDLAYYTRIIVKGCYYCKKDLLTETGGNLDRINNDKGYLKRNVLPCCGDCNRTRGDRLTVDETKYIISKLLQYRKRKQNG